MQARGRLVRALLGAAALATSDACDDSSGRAFETTEGRWIDVRYEVGRKPCAGTTRFLDASFEAYARLAAVDLDTVGPMTATISIDELKSICPPGASACAMKGRAWMWSVADIHEIAHLATFHLRERPNHLLSEGFAVAATEVHESSPAYESGGDFWGAVDGFDGSRAHYFASADFVAFVLVHFGSPAFADLMREMPRAPTRNEFSAACMKALGVSLDELVALRLELGGELTGTQLARPECELEPMVLAAEGFEFDIDYACDDPNVAGLDYPPSRLYARRVVIPEAADYVLTAFPVGTQYVHHRDLFAPCGDVEPRAEGAIEIASIAPGTPYMLFVHRDVGDHALRVTGGWSSSISGSFRRVDPLEPPSVPGGVELIFLHARVGVPVAGRFATDVPIDATYFETNIRKPTLCSDDGSSTVCIVLSDLPSFAFVLPSGVHTLSFEAVEGADEGQIQLRLERP